MKRKNLLVFLLIPLVLTGCRSSSGKTLDELEIDPNLSYSNPLSEAAKNEAINTAKEKIGDASNVFIESDKHEYVYRTGDPVKDYYEYSKKELCLYKNAIIHNQDFKYFRQYGGSEPARETNNYWFIECGNTTKCAHYQMFTVNGENVGNEPTVAIKSMSSEEIINKYIGDFFSSSYFFPAKAYQTDDGIRLFANGGYTANSYGDSYRGKVEVKQQYHGAFDKDGHLLYYYYVWVAKATDNDQIVGTQKLLVNCTYGEKRNASTSPLDKVMKGKTFAIGFDPVFEVAEYKDGDTLTSGDFHQTSDYEIGSESIWEKQSNFGYKVTISREGTQNALFQDTYGTAYYLINGKVKSVKVETKQITSPYHLASDRYRTQSLEDGGGAFVLKEGYDSNTFIIAFQFNTENMGEYSVQAY